MTAKQELFEWLHDKFPDASGKFKFGVDTNAAAEALGRSPRTIQRWVAGTQAPPRDARNPLPADVQTRLYGSALAKRKSRTQQQAERAQERLVKETKVARQRDHFLRAFTGNKDLKTGPDASVKTLLQNKFPSTKNASGIDTAAAAKHYGRTPDTIRKWARHKSRPGEELLTRMRSEARRMATTKQGRKNALAQASDRDRPAGSQARIALSGVIGPKTKDPNKPKDAYLRKRTIEVNISWEEFDKLAEAYINGGEDAATAQMFAHFQNIGYPDDFYAAEVDGVGVGNSRSPRSVQIF